MRPDFFAQKKAAELEESTSSPDFWGDQENSSKVLKEIKRLKGKISAYESLESKLEGSIYTASGGTIPSATAL